LNTIITHVRHDTAHCLAPGLFRSLKKGERKKNKLDVTYEYGNNTCIRFIGFEPLGVDDMRLLQAIIGMSGLSKYAIEHDKPVEGTSNQLRELLNANMNHHEWKSKVLITSMYSIMKVIGYKDHGKKRQQILESLRRLSNVNIIYRKNLKEFSTKMLSYVVDEKDGSLYIANNPKITDAILGNSSFTYISMNEARSLKTDIARILHQRLSAVIDLGKTKKINIDTLVDYVWISTKDKISSAIRMRKKRIKESLKEIEQTKGWKIYSVSSICFEIKRLNKNKNTLPDYQ
jgi:hypothetical protein